MIRPDFELIIFDCDGTLVDSEPITYQVLVNYVKEFGLEVDPLHALSLFIGRDMAGIIKVFEQKLGHSLPEHFADEFRKRQAVALRSDLQVIAGAKELLERVERKKCVASNAPRKKIAINLEVTKLNGYFAEGEVFSAYDIQVWKPAPDLFLYAAEKMGCHPDRCVVIEDSDAGVEAGLAAGMQVIGFTGGGERTLNNVPCVDALSELIPVLGGPSS